MLLRTFQEFLTEGKLKVHSVVHKGQHIGTVWHSKGVVSGEHIHGAKFMDMSGTRNKKERMAAIALRMAKHHDSLAGIRVKVPTNESAQQKARLTFSAGFTSKAAVKEFLDNKELHGDASYPSLAFSYKVSHGLLSDSFTVLISGPDGDVRKWIKTFTTVLRKFGIIEEGYGKEEFLPEAKWSTPAKRKYDPFCDCQVYQISPCETCQKQHKKHGVKDEYDRAGHERARSIEKKKWYRKVLKNKDSKPLKESGWNGRSASPDMGASFGPTDSGMVAPKSLMFSVHDKGRRCPECSQAKGLKHKADCSKRQKPLKESVYVVKAVHRQTGETKKFPVRALMKRAPHIHMRDIKAKVAKVFDNHEITVEPHNAI